jgi:hypothetical protein
MGTNPTIDPTIDTSQGAVTPSVLSQTIAPQMPNQMTGTPAEEADMNAAQQGPDIPPAGGSRLQAIIKAIASVGSTALAGVPDKGRPSFVSGLGEGARAGQAAQATQQDIKFKSFNDQVRLADLHNQDIELQNRTQAQSDAHQKMQDDQQDWDNDHGIDYNPIPNTSDAALNHLTAQTAANGAASIPPGTHLSADGNTINVPADTQATRDGQLAKYNTFAPLYGLPALPEGAKFVPPKYMDLLTHVQQGYGVDGHPINHDNLPASIASLQTQRDAFAKNGSATPTQLQALDNTIAIQKANLKALDDHAATVEQNKKAADVAAENSPDAIAGAANKAKAISDATQGNKVALQDNAAGNKTQKAQSTDWVPGVSADEKKKAELAENIAFNANEVAKIVMNRPDILGAVAGRYTNTQQMIGNNDPDISALGVHIHNMAMANSGVHGFRSQEGVESYEKQILNNFKNGPKAMAGALRASTGSVQTFIDNARPDTYKTHSKNGGAVTGMMQ